jgi:hypothetical protein
MKELSRKYGGIAFAGKDVGAPRDAMAIYEVRQDKLPVYSVEASAYYGLISDG